MPETLDYKSLCAKGGEKCDLHFLVENELIQTKNRVDKLESRTTDTFDVLNRSVNELIIEMRSYVQAQGFRDDTSREMKKITLSNTTDINDLKGSLTRLDDRMQTVATTNDRISGLLESVRDDIRDMDKGMMRKADVIEIVDKAIITDKKQGADKWFETLPAKVSAIVAVLTFITYWIIKIIVLFMSMG